MILLLVTQEIIAQQCNQSHPYLLNSECVTQCATGISIIDENGSCLSRCIGNLNNDITDSNNNIIRVCKSCPDQTPFYFPTSSRCIDKCPLNNMVDQDKVCIDECTNGHKSTQILNNTAGQFEYILCQVCSSAFPFYNSITQQCTNNCNKTKDIYVNEKNECITEDQCYVKEPLTLGNLHYIKCHDCNKSQPFIQNGSCVNQCNISDINNLIDENQICLKTCQGTTKNAVIDGYSVTICEKCPPSAPFWNGSNCVLQCDQQFNGISTVSEEKVCQEYTTGYLNKINLYSIPYYEITSYCTTKQTANEGKVCLSCAEIDPTKPFLNGFLCDNKCEIQFHGQNLLTYQLRCLSYISSSIDLFLPRLSSLDFTTQYYINVDKCPSGQNVLQDGFIQCIPCLYSNTTEENAKCNPLVVNQLVDINNIVQSSCPDNYKQLIFNSRTYCLPACNYYGANSLSCLETCDIKNILYYGNNIAYCLNNLSSNSVLRVQITDSTNDYFAYQEQTLTQCPNGYKQVVDNCIKVQSCQEYAGFCDSIICQSYSYDTNGVCENRCLGSSTFDANKVCTTCPSGQFVENNTCVQNCSLSTMFHEDGKCVTQCTILTINNLPVLDSANNKTCLISCNTYMYQQDGQQHYVCQNNCSSSNKPYFQVYNYKYNQFTLDANVCVEKCQQNQGSLKRDTETQCLICHENMLVNQQGVCQAKCTQEGETVYYDVDGYCQLGCSGYVFNGEKCYKSCKSNNLVVSSNKQNCTTSCTTGQSISTSLLENEDVCVDSCPYFSQNGYCVAACNASYPFIFNNNTCTTNCNGSVVIVVNQRNQCVNQCNHITVPKQYDYINYYICTPNCFALNMVHFNRMCYDNCYQAQQTQNTTSVSPQLYKYNGNCLDSCPSDNYYIEKVSQESICSGLTQSQKLGIGVGIAVAIVIIIIILVPVILVILKKKNIIKFKYPLPKAKQPQQKSTNSINLYAVQQALDSESLINNLQKAQSQVDNSKTQTYT